MNRGRAFLLLVLALVPGGVLAAIGLLVACTPAQQAEVKTLEAADVRALNQYCNARDAAVKILKAQLGEAGAASH